MFVREISFVFNFPVRSYSRLKTTTFWDVALRSLAETDVSEVLTTSITRTSKTSVKFYQTTERNIPEYIFVLLAVGS
jgi:hypothetical protein